MARLWCCLLNHTPLASMALKHVASRRMAAQVIARAAESFQMSMLRFALVIHINQKAVKLEAATLSA